MNTIMIALILSLFLHTYTVNTFCRESTVKPFNDEIFLDKGSILVYQGFHTKFRSSGKFR